MEHHSHSIPAPVRQVIGNLITFPSNVFSEAAEKNRSKRQGLHARLDLQEKEEELQRLQSALNARSAELQKKEQQMSERWDAGRIYDLPVSSISANPYQPRREFEDLSLFSLANSIRAYGILQPLTVRRMPQNDENCPSAHRQPKEETYQLIAGERRLRAAVAVGMEHVPCIILEADGKRSAELALIENLQRENLNPFEQAGAIAALIDIHAMTQEEIARALSVSQSCIANKLRILRLTNEEREIILSAHLTERHARAFLRIKDLSLRKETVHLTAAQCLNVAQTEQYIDTLLEQSQPTPLTQQSQPSTADHEAAPDRPRPQSRISAPVQPQKRKGLLRDLRLLFNTVERAAAAAREAGYAVDCTTREDGDTVILTVSVNGLTAPPTHTGASNDTYSVQQREKSTEIVSRETDHLQEIANIR